MLTIGDIVLPVPCMLAPMAGVSDLPFRLITRSFGAPLAFTEMIDARALSQKDSRTCRMLSSASDDRPLGIQLLGNDEKYCLKALDVLNECEFEIIDFNAACPSPKVTRKGQGAALLKEPVILKQILKTIVDRSKIPVTVKIRAGWDADSINARDVALYAEDAGISALFIHGRTKTQGYSGTVDYGIIKDVKDALKIPVIASGDNITVSTVKKMFDETGCDGVAIARGALGNPWIFRELIPFLKDGRLIQKPSLDERIMVMKGHLNLSVQHWGEKRGVASFHKFFIWYTKGISGAKPLRDKAFRTNTLNDMLAAIDDMRSLGENQ